MSQVKPACRQVESAQRDAIQKDFDACRLFKCETLLALRPDIQIWIYGKLAECRNAGDPRRDLEWATTNAQIARLVTDQTFGVVICEPEVAAAPFVGAPLVVTQSPLRCDTADVRAKIEDACKAAETVGFEV